MRIQIINGPNINLLGKREPSIYGAESFESYLEKLRMAYPDLTIDYYQSNIEGKMIDKIHEVGFEDTGIILNAGAYTHTPCKMPSGLFPPRLSKCTSAMCTNGKSSATDP